MLRVRFGVVFRCLTRFVWIEELVYLAVLTKSPIEEGCGNPISGKSGVKRAYMISHRLHQLDLAFAPFNNILAQVFQLFN